MDNPQAYYPYAFAVLIAIPFLLFFKQFVHSFIKFKTLEHRGASRNSQNKLLAYERMTLFLERLKPANLVTKFDASLAIPDFIFLTEKALQEEYDYNAAQQLYIRRETWEQIAATRGAIVQMLHSTYANMAPGATLQDFKTLLLLNYISGEDFISATIDSLRSDIND